jgi:hypothetical protein
VSYWVHLTDRTKPHWCSYGVKPEDFKPQYEGDVPCPVPCYPDVEVENHSEGGTYALGGISEACLNVTYNYSRCYAPFDFNLRDLDGKPAKDATEKLREIVKALGKNRDNDDYWAATPGNAGHALSILLDWAEQHPEATFVVN